MKISVVEFIEIEKRLLDKFAEEHLQNVKADRAHFNLREDYMTFVDMFYTHSDR